MTFSKPSVQCFDFGQPVDSTPRASEKLSTRMALLTPVSGCWMLLGIATLMLRPLLTLPISIWLIGSGLVVVSHRLPMIFRVMWNCLRMSVKRAGIRRPCERPRHT
jgi:hypothetical protein